MTSKVAKVCLFLIELSPLERAIRSAFSSIILAIPMVTAEVNIKYQNWGCFRAVALDTFFPLSIKNLSVSFGRSAPKEEASALVIDAIMMKGTIKFRATANRSRPDPISVPS